MRTLLFMVMCGVIGSFFGVVGFGGGMAGTIPGVFLGWLVARAFR